MPIPWRLLFECEADIVGKQAELVQLVRPIYAQNISTADDRITRIVLVQKIVVGEQIVWRKMSK